MSIHEISLEHPRILSVKIMNEEKPASRFLVVVPTYNEEGNIQAIIKAVDALAEGFDIMVVDDKSKDRTAECVIEVAASCSRRVYLMQRKGKLGLGSAYLDAFRWMTESNLPYEVYMQMDADFSHDPKFLPKLAEGALANGVGVGSRYVKGGSTPDWAFGRRCLSRFANMYARFILRLRTPSFSVRDTTAGFMAYRTDVLKGILTEDVIGNGYSYLISMKYLAVLRGFRPFEVPIIFPDRRVGQSKMSKAVIFESVKTPWRLIAAPRKKI